MTQPAPTPAPAPTPVPLSTLVANLASTRKTLLAASAARQAAQIAWDNLLTSAGIKGVGRRPSAAHGSAPAPLPAGAPLPDFNVPAATLISAQVEEKTATTAHNAAVAAHQAYLVDQGAA
jgi:hypothetical protein